MKEAKVVLNNKLFDDQDKFDMQWVRNMSALGFDKKYMTDEMFLDKYHTFLSQKSADSWKDEWTPEMNLLYKDTGDVYTLEEFQESLKSDKEKIKNLRETVKQNIKKKGNCHWGVDYDITNISNVLNIGFIILQKDLEIYCLPLNKNEYPYYMFIYYISETHYKLGFVNGKCFYPCNQLPKALLDQFNNKCNDNKITCS
jgi:hypothetical protein